MNPKNNDWQTLKRYMYAMKDYSDRINGAGVNGLIADSCQAAYDSLGPEDKANIDAACQVLINNCRKLGKQGALEVLATLGQLVTVQDGEMEVQRAS